MISSILFNTNRLFGWLGFMALDYLIPNPVFTYILNIYD